MANVDYIVRLRDQFTAGFNKFKAGATAADQAIDGINNKLGTMNQIVGGLALGALGVGVVDTAAKMEGFRKAIVFASGSAEEGAKNLMWIESRASSLGLDIEALTKGFKTLSGATMGTALAGEETRKVFNSVSEAAAAMGLNGEETEGIMLALGQMISKGTVQAEELKGQLGERLPGAFQAAARAMGVTTSELGDMMKEGKVVAEDFLPKLQAELHKTFSIEARKNKDSINGNIAALKNMWTLFATKMIPVVSKFIKGLVEMATWLKNNTSVIYAIVAAGSTLLALYGAIKVAQIAIALTNPFTATVVGITATVAALAYLYNEFEGVRVVMNGIFNFMESRFKSLYGIVVGFGKVLKGAFTLDWDTFKEGIVQYGKGFANVVTGYDSIQQAFKATGENRLAGVMSSLTGLKDSIVGGGSGANSLGSAGGSGGALGKDSNIDKTIGGIAGGKPSSIILHIDSLIKENNNIVNNIKNPGELKEFEKKLIGALLKVTNDAQIAIG